MKQKGFAPVIILVLISLIVVGYLGYKNYIAPKGTILGPFLPSPTATTTPDPTVNWKTYNNDKYKYSFKLPGEWSEMFLNAKKGDLNTLDIMHRNKDNDTKITIFVQKMGTQEIGSEKYVFRDGTTGTRMSTNPGLGTSHDLVVVKAKDVDYVIDFEFKTLDATNSKILFGQILSTFKFTTDTTK